MINIGRYAGYDQLFLCPEAGESNRRRGIRLPVRQFTPLSMSFPKHRPTAALCPAKAHCRWCCPRGWWTWTRGWESSLAAPTRPTADVALGDEEGLFELVAERGSLTRLGAKRTRLRRSMRGPLQLLRPKRKRCCGSSIRYGILPDGYRNPSSGRFSCSLYQGATTERAMAAWSASASNAAVTSMVRPLGVLFTCTTRRSQARTQQSD